MVDILMATYNGEKYIQEQINSILNQSFIHWQLYIRDDGSKDNTVEIINNYQKKYPNKIEIIKDNKKGLGAKNNFFELTKYSKNKYIMFCDQDDVWLEDKIQICIDKITNIEKKHAKKIPILVYSDLKVVDKDLNIINESFWDYMNIDCNKNTLNYLMIENIITGCTVMVNKTLIKLIDNISIPKNCLMHDWWMGLLASNFGKIEKIDKATILYRQHEFNQVGAKKTNILKKIKNKKFKPLFYFELKQMESFYEVYTNIMNEKNKELIQEFLNIKQANFIKKNKIIFKNKIFANSKFKNLKNILSIK